jgi:hypothetical protein
MGPSEVVKAAAEAARGQVSVRPKLDVVAARPAAEPAANDSVPQPQQQRGEAGSWLSERDFMRTLELVDRACHDLKVSEERVRTLEARHEELLQHAAEKFDEAQDLIRAAEERASRAEQWAKSLEERTIRAEARAIEAEERCNAQEEWLGRIQRAIERFNSDEQRQF